MTYSEGKNLYKSLTQMGYLQGVRFAFARALNLSALKPFMEALDNSLEFSQEYKDYELKRIELLEKLSKKDENGKSIIVNNSYVLEDPEDFDKKFEILKEENKDVIEKQKQKNNDYEELLKKEIDIKLEMVDLSDISDTINGTQLETIMPMINYAK